MCVCDRDKYVAHCLNCDDKIIKLYTLNMYSLVYINYIAQNLKANKI